MSSPCYQRPPIPATPAQILASMEASRALTYLGQPVILHRDDNRELQTILTELPTQRPGGLWTVRVQGCPGAHTCTQVRPFIP